MSFDIRNYLDALEPSPKGDGKYICPVPGCGGNDLSINTKTGAYSCYSSECDPTDIRNAIVPLPQGDRKASGTRAATPRKSAKGKARAVQLDSARVEAKVDELLLLVSQDYHSLEQAQVELGIWCKAESLNAYDAGQLLKAKAKDVGIGGKTRPELLTLEQVKQQLERLIIEGVTQSDIEIQIADLARCSGEHPQTIQRIYNSLQSEADLKTATLGASGDLAQLRAIQGQRLPFREGLFGDGGRVADKIQQVAEAMPTAPEFLVTTLIPALATAMGTAHTLIIHATAGYTARPIFRSIIVAGTGRKKTPAQGAILGAITNLEESAALDYEHELATYEQDYRQWAKVSKGNDDPGPEPAKPKRRRFMTQDNTLAARIQIHSENPRGLLLYKDEASAFITERGRFTSGKGDGGETEADLSEFNGGAIMCDRKGDGSTFLAKTAISRVGATQFSTLQKMMGDHEDGNGEFARYLVCAAEAPPSKIDLSKDVGDIGLTSAVMALFDKLQKLPEASYLLSIQAKSAFQHYQHELTDRQLNEDHPGLQAAYPKFETYFGRFILWLHLVNAALADQAPAPVVDEYTVELARQWTEYFIGQLRLVLAANSPQQELTGDLLRVYEYLKRKDQPLDVRTIQGGRLFARSADKAKARSHYLKELLSTLVEQGWIAQQDGLYSLRTPDISPSIERNVERPAQQNLDVEQPVEQMLSSGQPIQQTTGQGFSGFIEQNVEQLSRLSNKSAVGQTNGHHPKPSTAPLSDRELTDLLGGGHNADG